MSASVRSVSAMRSAETASANSTSRRDVLGLAFMVEVSYFAFASPQVRSREPYPISLQTEGDSSVYVQHLRSRGFSPTKGTVGPSNRVSRDHIPQRPQRPCSAIQRTASATTFGSGRSPSSYRTIDFRARPSRVANSRWVSPSSRRRRLSSRPVTTCEGYTVSIVQAGHNRCGRAAANRVGGVHA
jgi:hypothetical protein